jgi:hypothetical protein
MLKTRYFIAVSLILALAGCSGIRSNAVVPVQSKDKQLTCREMLLEMNEAEQYKTAAEKNKNPGVRSFLAPFGYMYTLTSAEEAIESSEKRIAYLRDVYQISGCASGASGLTDQQLRGHTFTGGFPTPSPEQQRSPY